METLKRNLKAMTLIATLMFSSVSQATMTVLDLMGKKENSQYNVEIKKENSQYNVVVLQTTTRGQSDVIYESQNLTQVPRTGMTEYTDGRLQVFDHGGGRATFILDNGQKLEVELGQ